MTRLVRSGRGGATIHLATCKRIPGTHWPWEWAEGRDDLEWARLWDGKPPRGRFRFKPCMICLPEVVGMQDGMKLKAGIAS